MFDIIPFPAIIVDEDVRIIQYNPAASNFFNTNGVHILQHWTGDVLHCLHVSDHPAGCGHGPACKECVIRKSVTEAFEGRHVARKRAKLDVKRGDNVERIYALITAAPLPYGVIPLVLLLIEDIREVTELQRLIPLCSKCKKVRDKDRIWMTLEAYFKTTWDVDFSHGYCPDCIKEEMGLMRNQADLLKSN
jgi:hypothetical protein